MISQQVIRLHKEMDMQRPMVSRHCQVVARLAANVASKAGLESENVTTAAMLHDFGKILWPPDLFAKAKKDLTLYDLSIISSHPEVGSRLIAKKWPECPIDVLGLIEHHHCPEGWISTQILAACDVWVACHEDRPYRREAVPERVVLQEMLRVAPEGVTGRVLDALKSDFAYKPLLLPVLDSP